MMVSESLQKAATRLLMKEESLEMGDLTNEQSALVLTNILKEHKNFSAVEIKALERAVHVLKGESTGTREKSGCSKCGEQPLFHFEDGM